MAPHPITNFGGNLTFTPGHFYAPSTEDEVLAILDRHANGKIRVIGARHSWSPAIVCDDALLDLRHFDRVAIERDSEGATWATVGGGCRIKDVLRKLHRLGDVTMPSIGLITEQTIAGAIATATHGSGRHSLSHYITEVRAAAYDSTTGKARIYIWTDGLELRAARCALGCMGIILSVRFQCVPKYDVTETIEACATIDDALAGEGAFPLQQFYLVPHLWKYFAQRRAPCAYEAEPTIAARLYRIWWFACIDVALHLTIKVLTCVLRNPAATRLFYRHVLSKCILKNVTIADHSDRMLVMEHELFKHLEIEIFVAAKHVRAAAIFVREILEVFDGTRGLDGQSGLQFGPALNGLGMRHELRLVSGTFTHHYAVTFRKVLPDDALISMTGGADEPWYAISFITYVEPRDAFFAMASFLARSMSRLFNARQHWGKYFPLSGAEVARNCPNLAEFRAACRSVDPRGVFRNDFTERVLFGEDEDQMPGRTEVAGMDQTMTSASGSTTPPLAIVIGVAGHRDLRPDDRPALESRVREILGGLQAHYPATPMVLLSSLAEGADRLAARVALELGYRLIVPLPMVREDYAKDFQEPAVEFDELLAKAEISFTVATLDHDDAQRRSHCYAVASAYIARHSQILLALWDGKETTKVGGTAHAVRFKRVGVEAPYGPPSSPLDPAESGPVYQVVTPRISNPTLPAPLTLVKQFPLDQPSDADKAEKAHHKVFTWMNEFNRDAGQAPMAERRQSERYVFPDAVADKVPLSVRGIVSLYAIADALAIQFSRRTLLTLRCLLLLAFSATLVFQIYAYLHSKPTVLLAIYLGLGYAACPALYFWARYKGNFQNKYLDYRALAEGLRVLIFWRLAGLKTPVADHYLRKQRTEMDWIRQAIRVATIRIKRQDTPLGDADSLRLVLTHWVEDQAAFYDKRGKKDGATARWLGWLGLAFFLIGLILPIMKLFTEAEHPIIVAMSVTVVVAALVHVYSRVLGFSEHAHQYERMGGIFTRGARRLRELLDAGRLEEARELISELGREALIENGEWLLFHRRQPVHVPGGLGSE